MTYASESKKSCSYLEAHEANWNTKLSGLGKHSLAYFIRHLLMKRYERYSVANESSKKVFQAHAIFMMMSSGTESRLNCENVPFAQKAKGKG